MCYFRKISTQILIITTIFSIYKTAVNGFGMNLMKIPDDSMSQWICPMALLRKYYKSGEALSGSVLFMSLTAASVHTQTKLLEAIHAMNDFPWSVVVCDPKMLISTEDITIVLHEKPQCYFVVIENLEDDDLEYIFEDWKITVNWNPLAQFVVYLASVEETDEEMTELMGEILLNFMHKKIYNVNVIGQSEEKGYYYGKTVFPYHPDNNCGNRVISIETLDVCDYSVGEKSVDNDDENSSNLEDNDDNDDGDEDENVDRDDNNGGEENDENNQNDGENEDKKNGADDLGDGEENGDNNDKIDDGENEITNNEANDISDGEKNVNRDDNNGGEENDENNQNDGENEDKKNGADDLGDGEENGDNNDKIDDGENEITNNEANDISDDEKNVNRDDNNGGEEIDENNQNDEENEDKKNGADDLGDGEENGDNNDKIDDRENEITNNEAKDISDGEENVNRDDNNRDEGSDKNYHNVNDNKNNGSNNNDVDEQPVSNEKGVNGVVGREENKSNDDHDDEENEDKKNEADDLGNGEENGGYNDKIDERENEITKNVNKDTSDDEENFESKVDDDGENEGKQNRDDDVDNGEENVTKNHSSSEQNEENENGFKNVSEDEGNISNRDNGDGENDSHSSGENVNNKSEASHVGDAKERSGNKNNGVEASNLSNENVVDNKSIESSEDNDYNSKNDKENNKDKYNSENIVDKYKNEYKKETKNKTSEYNDFKRAVRDIQKSFYKPDNKRRIVNKKSENRNYKPYKIVGKRKKTEPHKQKFRKYGPTKYYKPVGKRNRNRGLRFSQQHASLQDFKANPSTQPKFLPLETKFNADEIDNANNSSINETKNEPHFYFEEMLRALFLDKFPKDLSGCPLAAAYRPWEPYIFKETTEIVQKNATENSTLPNEDNKTVQNNDLNDYNTDLISSEEKEHDKSLSGIEYQLLQTISERLHISIDLQAENSNLYNLFQKLIDGDIEMVIGGIDEDPSMSQYVSSTIPYHQDDLTWCVAKAKRSSNLFNFLASFSAIVWMCSFIYLIVTSLTITLAKRLLKLRLKQFNGFFSIMFRVWSIVYNQSLPFSIKGISLRFIFLPTFFLAVIFINAYQSFLISTLTTPKSAYQINRVEEIYQNRMTIKGGVENVRHLYKEGEIFKYIREKYEMCYNIEECLMEAAENEHIAVVVSRQHSFYNPRIPRNRLYCFDRNENLYIYLVTMLLPKKFHLLHKINPVIQHVIESGHMQKWARDLDMRRRILEERNHIHEDKFRSLTLGQVKGTFAFTGFLLGIAFIAHMLELCVYRLSTKRRRTRLKIIKFLHRQFLRT